MKEPQHLQIAQNRGRRGPCTAVRIRAGFSVQLPHSSEAAQRAQPHRVQSAPAGPCSARWQHGNPTPRDTPFFVPMAGRDTSSNASSNIPISCLEGSAGQLSRSGVNSSLPAMTGGCRKKPSGIIMPTPCLFWMAVAKVQSLCCVHFPIMLRSPSIETSHAKLGVCFPASS